jgi:hypothetical protein
MLPDFFGCGQERLISPKIRHDPLQGPRVLSILYLSLLGKGTHLRSAPALPQALLPEANLTVSGVPDQEFFFR